MSTRINTSSHSCLSAKLQYDARPPWSLARGGGDDCARFGSRFGSCNGSCRTGTHYFDRVFSLSIIAATTSEAKIEEPADDDRSIPINLMSCNKDYNIAALQYCKEASILLLVEIARRHGTSERERGNMGRFRAAFFAIRFTVNVFFAHLPVYLPLLFYTVSTPFYTTMAQHHCFSSSYSTLALTPTGLDTVSHIRHGRSHAHCHNKGRRTLSYYSITTTAVSLF
jgi:hypothetical protein